MKVKGLYKLEDYVTANIARMEEEKLGMKKDSGELQDLKTEYYKFHMSEEQVEKMKQQIEKGKRDLNRARRKNAGIRWAATAAACVALFVLLPNTSANVAHAMSRIPLLGRLVDVVTYRDYSYEDDRHSAQITVPELVVTLPEEGEEVSPEVQENMKKTAEEINAQIQQITEGLVAEFEEGLQYQEGYQDMIVDSEIISRTEDFFSLKLICYQGAGSGAEWDYFYTVDLNTGKQLALSDLFEEGADFVTPVSDNIKEQMLAQMAEDESKMYWVDNTDIPEWNFEAITEETSFYLNEDGRLVICFNEGDVAPMYMGCVEFTIPEEVLGDIWSYGNM